MYRKESMINLLCGGNMPKVSVIVPVYNVEKYVEKCLMTLINQTLKDIEIIVVNDGSTDNSKEIIKKYCSNFPEKIKYYEKENGGLSDARNYGMQYATGDYIAFLDSDDYVELDTYEKLYNKAINENSDIVECDFIWEYPDKKVIDKGIIYGTKKGMITYARVVAWNKLIRRELIEKSGVIYPKGLRYEDIEFFYKMVPFYDKVSFVKEPLIHYIQRDSSISNVQNERTKEIFEVLDNVISYYKEKNIYDEYKYELEYTYTRILLCSSLFRMVKITDKETRRRLLNMTWDKLNSEFPDWKNNPILKNNKNKKNMYIKSVNKFTYKIYCFIFRIIK